MPSGLQLKPALSFMSRIKRKTQQYIPLSLIPETLQGILLALMSTGLFVITGVLVRILSERIDLFQVLLFRQLIFILVLLPAIIMTFDTLMKPRLVHLHALRITGAFFALYLGFVTVSHIPLADATALGFSQVLFVALISRAFLAEPVGMIRIITILIGFVGVLFVVQPSFADSSLLYTFTGFSAALGAAIAVSCVKKMAKTETRTALLSYQAIFVGFIALIPSLYVWQWPTAYEWLLLVLVGAISSVAQWLGVSAYKLAQANVIANVEYAKIIYSTALGYFLFNELPNTLASIGIVIIIASAFVPLLRRASVGH